jgi:hypothetical protein
MREMLVCSSRISDTLPGVRAREHKCRISNEEASRISNLGKRTYTLNKITYLDVFQSRIGHHLPSFTDGIVIVIFVLNNALPQKSCHLGVFWRNSENHGKEIQGPMFDREYGRPLRLQQVRILDIRVIRALVDHNCNTVVTASILFCIRCQNILYSTTLVGIPSTKYLYNRFR